MLPSGFTSRSMMFIQPHEPFSPGTGPNFVPEPSDATEGTNWFVNTWFMKIGAMASSAL